MVALPRPSPSAEGQPFWDHLKQGELRVQRCLGCSALRHPPQPMCAECASMESEWTRMSGCGQVYSYVVTHQAIHPALVGRVPFATVFVELEEGPRITSNLTGVAPEAIRIGLPVELALEDVGDGVVMPFFRPAGSGD